MSSNLQEAGIPGPGSKQRDQDPQRSNDETTRSACVFPPISLAVGSIAASSDVPYLLSTTRGLDATAAAAVADNEQKGREFHHGGGGGSQDNDDDDDDDDEPRPGYAFVDSEDEYFDDNHECHGALLDRCELDADFTVLVQRGRGRGPVGELVCERDDEDDNDSHATSGSGGSYGGTETDGSIQDDDNTEPTSTKGRGETSPNTHQLLVELVARMRESRQLAQQQQDQAMSEPTELNPQSTASPSSALPLAPLMMVNPASYALQPRCLSRLGRSATARLYPNVVASLGVEMPRDRRNEPRYVGLLKADTLTDSEDDDDTFSDDSSQDGPGSGTNCRFEIWRVHASCDSANDGELCFHMWKARADFKSRQRNKDHHYGGGMNDHYALLLDDDVDRKSCTGGPASVQSDDARMMTSTVPVICDWIRKLRNDRSASRIMILSTAEDAAARNHPSYQVVSNLILNPNGSKSESVIAPAGISEPTPVEPGPTSSSLHGMRKLWPGSISDSKAADASFGKRVLVGAPPHGGLSTAPLERSQQLALDRLRCWKRRRPGCVVEAKTDVSSSATVASF